MTSKRCTKCDEFKSEMDFHQNGPGKLRPDCKDCVRDRMKRRDPAVERRWHVMKNYGLTIEEAEAIWSAESCHICGSTDPKDRRGKFNIDHCHKTGKVRGALCTPCNVGIGNLQDSPELLRAAADYIERYR